MFDIDQEQTLFTEVEHNTMWTEINLNGGLPKHTVISMPTNYAIIRKSEGRGLWPGFCYVDVETQRFI